MDFGVTPFDVVSLPTHVSTCGVGSRGGTETAVDLQKMVDTSVWIANLLGGSNAPWTVTALVS